MNKKTKIKLKKVLFHTGLRLSQTYSPLVEAVYWKDIQDLFNLKS